MVKDVEELLEDDPELNEYNEDNTDELEDEEFVEREVNSESENYGDEVGHVVTSEELKERMIRGLLDDEIAFEYNNSIYFMFNRIEIEIGGKEIYLLKDNKAISVTKLEHKIEPGDRVNLEGTLGFIEFKLEWEIKN